jgi:hypothetical protein
MAENLTVKKENIREVTNPKGYKPSTVPAGIIKSENLAEASNSSVGVFCEPLIEPIPHFIQAGCEKVFNHENINAQIVLGRDRPSTRFSGYGGSGWQRSAAIDLVVGRGGPSPIAVDNSGQKFWVDNNYAMDAARININQRTDIDSNFDIKTGIAAAGINVSGVGMKADCIRMVARKDVKIVTGTDFYDSKGRNPGVDYAIPVKISLIGENRDDLLQPMVKGENLMSFLTELTDCMHRLISAIDILVMHQNDINQKVMNHTHVSPFYGLSTSPSGELLSAFIPITKLLTDVKSSTLAITGLIESSKAEYLTLPSDGMANNNNILSNYNFCN